MRRTGEYDVGGRAFPTIFRHSPAHLTALSPHGCGRERKKNKKLMTAFRFVPSSNARLVCVFATMHTQTSRRHGLRHRTEKWLSSFSDHLLFSFDRARSFRTSLELTCRREEPRRLNGKARELSSEEDPETLRFSEDTRCSSFGARLLRSHRGKPPPLLCTIIATSLLLKLMSNAAVLYKSVPRLQTAVGKARWKNEATFIYHTLHRL